MTIRPPTVPPPPAVAGSASVFLRDVLYGLNQPHKRLPCKYFYDEIGGQLFDRICELEEYYPTRSESAIVARHASEMADWLGEGVVLIEYGSGASRKTRLLLDRLRSPAAYMPVDINGDQLKQVSRSLAQLYPKLKVHPIEADFTRLASLPVSVRREARRVVYFSGSTIGNFEPPAARELLTRIAGLCGPGGGLLIGVDLKKDPRILHAAYNDRQNVTAAFNRNLLARINRELGADFALDRYDHYAFYNPDPGRIEMHLMSRGAQTVSVGGSSFTLGDGESICTEYSYKYSLTDFERLTEGTGLRIREVWRDENSWFSVQFLSVEDFGSDTALHAGGCDPD